jgi:hypothetical protein
LATTAARLSIYRPETGAALAWKFTAGLVSSITYRIAGREKLDSISSLGLARFGSAAAGFFLRRKLESVTWPGKDESPNGPAAEARRGTTLMGLFGNGGWLPIDAAPFNEDITLCRLPLRAAPRMSSGDLLRKKDASSGPSSSKM